MHAANTSLLKVNQVGTLSEALETAACAKRNGYSVLVSERSAQTEDTWLADLTVAINAGQIKNGFESIISMECAIRTCKRWAQLRNFRTAQCCWVAVLIFNI